MLLLLECRPVHLDEFYTLTLDYTLTVRVDQERVVPRVRVKRIEACNVIITSMQPQTFL